MIFNTVELENLIQLIGLNGLDAEDADAFMSSWTTFVAYNTAHFIYPAANRSANRKQMNDQLRAELRPRNDRVIELLEQGNLTQKEIAKRIKAEFPRHPQLSDRQIRAIRDASTESGSAVSQFRSD